MLSSHLFLCLPCLLPPFTVPCKMVLARPDERETWPYHCSLRLFTVVRRSSCGEIACWILAWTSLLVTWSLYEMHSILRQHVISMACILLWKSAVRVRDSQAYRKIDVTRECISRILEWRDHDQYSFKTTFLETFPYFMYMKPWPRNTPLFFFKSTFLSETFYFRFLQLLMRTIPLLQTTFQIVRLIFFFYKLGVVNALH